MEDMKQEKTKAEREYSGLQSFNLGQKPFVSCEFFFNFAV